MDIFFVLLIKLLPLYLIILLGYIAGRYLAVQKETVATLLIYIIYPVVVFTAVVNAGVTPQKLALPLVLYAVSCILCLILYWTARFGWHDATRNLLAFGAGNANTGYFGVPVAVMIFGEEMLGMYILAIIGITFYENTLGFFITARGHHTAQESLQKLLRLPTLYAFMLGVIVSLSHVQLPREYFEIASSFRAAFTLLGMMVIGLGLAAIKTYEFDFRFVSLALAAKFVGWPLCMAAVIFADQHILHLWSSDIHHILLLISVMPLAANMVVFATQLKTHPEKASCTVLISTLLALAYIPLMVVLFIK